MVHYVVLKVDKGDPIMVQEIEIREGEELAQLEERIHKHEHELIVEAAAMVVREILKGRGGSEVGDKEASWKR